MNVTCDPYADGFADEARMTVALALLTVSVSAKDELLVSLISPP